MQEHCHKRSSHPLRRWQMQPLYLQRLRQQLLRHVLLVHAQQPQLEQPFLRQPSRHFLALIYLLPLLQPQPQHSFVQFLLVAQPAGIHIVLAQQRRELAGVQLLVVVLQLQPVPGGFFLQRQLVPLQVLQRRLRLQVAQQQFADASLLPPLRRQQRHAQQQLVPLQQFLLAHGRERQQRQTLLVLLRRRQLVQSLLALPSLQQLLQPQLLKLHVVLLHVVQLLAVQVQRDLNNQEDLADKQLVPDRRRQH